MRFLLALSYLFSSSLLAKSDPGLASPLEPLASPYLLKLTGGLLLVVMVIFLFAWLAKKLKLNQQAQNGLIRIVAGLSTGTRDRILLLQVGEEQILVGLTPGRIEKIHVMSQPIEVAQGEPISTSFADKLNSLMSQRDKS